jgi:hypothetical protein
MLAEDYEALYDDSRGRIMGEHVMTLDTIARMGRE